MIFDVLIVGLVYTFIGSSTAVESCVIDLMLPLFHLQFIPEPLHKLCCCRNLVVLGYSWGSSSTFVGMLKDGRDNVEEAVSGSPSSLILKKHVSKEMIHVTPNKGFTHGKVMGLVHVIRGHGQPSPKTGPKNPGMGLQMLSQQPGRA
jgi:hypothetical protein